MRKFNLLIIPIVLAIISCGTLNIGNVPFQSWTPYQKANFFMQTWTAEKTTYDKMNAMENKPDDLVEVLKVKQKVLEQSRIPIRIYVSMVSQGEIPDQESEQAIVDWLRTLQYEYIYGR